jgi:hypothetical protein
VIDFPPSRFVRAEVSTLTSVFDHVAVIAPQSLLEGSAGGNFVLVASDAPIDVTAIQDAISARGGAERVITGEAARDFAGDVRTLRDEFAPVDQLLSRP